MIRRLCLLLAFSFMLIASVAHAQDVVQPIIAVSKGDIYTINPADGRVTQVTHHPSIAPGGSQPSSQRDLAMSSDGHYLAYRRTPRFFQIAMKNNLIGNFGETPSDIVLLDLTTGKEKVIAEQQPNVKFDDNVRLWYRGYLTWSPDGSQLAYTQTRGIQGQTNFQAQVMLYNVQDDQTATFVNGKQYLGELAWLMEGISSDTTLWDIEGNLIVTMYVNDGVVFEHFTPYQYNEYAIVDSADVIPHDGRVYLMEMLTGQYSVVQGIQSSVSDNNPDDSLVFIKDDNDTRPSYVINPKTGARFDPPKQAPYAVDFTFSPDGHQFAYILLDTSVNISDLNGHDLSVPFKADSILWSRKRYTVASQTGDQSAFPDPTSDFDNEKRCGTLPPVELVSEGQGKVIMGGGANNIRKEPSPDAAKIGQIPEGGTFKVAYGQQNVCNGGIRWAQVEYQGVTGWTAEGADGQAFLEPVQ